eukprot:gene7545-10280_t
MGSASSIQMSPRGSENPPIDGVLGEDELDANGKKKDIRSSVRRNQKINHRIFDRQETNDVDINTLLTGDPVTEDTRKVLITALSGFFFLQSSTDEINPKMDLLIKGMKKETFNAGFLLITEGESGSKLYVVESGDLEVTINGTVIRQMGKGSMCGELALLYDAPRSATVQCKTNSVLWSLSREIFKKIQAISATANQIQRARWLLASPELSALSQIDLSRLVGTLQTLQFNTGDKVFTEGANTNQIILVERGQAEVKSSKVTSGTKADMDKELCITRPRGGKRKSVEFMNATELGKYLEDNKDDALSPRLENEKSDVNKPSPYSVFEGCIIGVGALRGKANMTNSWTWSNNTAVSPLTMVAVTHMTCLAFTVDVFENLFGSVDKVINRSKADATVVLEKQIVKEIVFDSTRFKSKFILGSGSFGVVTLAEYRPDKSQNVVTYALKSLSKLAVIETGQLRHVLDERKILSIMDSPFILKLYGTYQTPHQLVMVTEPLNCGDLWSVVYETPPFCDNCGIPFNLAVFYTVILVLALAHIHEQGVVFRDLKPENIMLDEKGYLRVIDFGFAKKVPFTKVDANGEVKVYAKTYTLCGTPEYLSPELIFNLGHNHASDLWALGVIIYEMFMAVTPFAPKRPDNVTELFTNIAMVKKNGLVLSSRIDQHAGTHQARLLISQILKADPTERIGVQEGSTRAILDHAFFGNCDINAIKNLTAVPDFIPHPQNHHEPLSSLMPVRPFNGDQSLFADF